MSDDQHLREENERLTAELARQASELARQAAVIGKLQHYIRGLLRGRYGRATEKLLGDTPENQQILAEVEAFLNAERSASGEIAVASGSAPAVPAAAPAAPPLGLHRVGGSERAFIGSRDD